MGKSRPLEICMAASEALPYAKSGGLADVVGALSKVLAGMGCRVHLFHPLYRSVKDRFPALKVKIEKLVLNMGGERVVTGIFEHRPAPGVISYLVKEDGSFDRPGLYGDDQGDYPDNARRFSIFCRSVVKTIEHLGLIPHVIHVHDWQTALIPLYLRHRLDLFPALSRIPSVMTIHNLAYQGIFPRETLDVAGIPEDLYTMEGVEFYGKVNFLKGGIVYADSVTTVSRRYSREIQTEENGAGLEDVLAKRSDSLHGILNGADYDVWNPAVDPHLPANYSLENLSGKDLCKTQLLRTFDLLPDLKAPLLATISRLIDQKGFDIIARAMPAILDLGFRFVLLGSGEQRYVDIFSTMARRYPERMGIKIAYDEPLAHRIEAGADFFLMPSRFEPCGLNQIYSLRYGTIPIVRATGGLDDTITNYDPNTGSGNGLKFEEYSADALSLKAHEAFMLFKSLSHRIQVIKNAMVCDFSWATSAGQYIDLYRSIISSDKAAN